MLSKLLKLADNSVEKTKGNNIIENEELEVLKEKINNGSLKNVFTKKTFGTVDTKNLENYIYLDAESTTRLSKIKNPVRVNVDYSNLKAGEYYIDDYKRVKNKDGSITETPVAYQIQKSGQGKGTNWSEGLDRNIEHIKLSDTPNENLAIVKAELEEIGKEMGFDVQQVHGGGMWIEDYSIRRADGKVYLQNSNDTAKIKPFVNEIISSRKQISAAGQGNAADAHTLEYSYTVPEQDKVASNTYLEGGNVLNTCLADGTPGAVIGQESIAYSLKTMGLETNEENIELAKKQIADDLGLKPENITYIPQFDFHIDMLYRPLHNGEIAIPDYEEGIKILKETSIPSMDEETKTKLLAQLEALKEKTAPITQEAEENLLKGSYKITKIPCFSTLERKGPQINYMNGVGGTSKSGTSFYITNKSDYPELNDAVGKYFNKAGVDKLYFVSTVPMLKNQGGIDCITQEI